MSRNPVFVYVWVSLVKAKSPGHAAMALTQESTCFDDGYISFAPKVSGCIDGPGKFYDRHHDKKHYQNRGLWVGEIHGLDVDAMWQRWNRDRQRSHHYSIRNECATVVHRYLKAGGGDQFATWWSSKVLAFWSPDDVEDYARSIIQSTHRLGSNGKKFRGEGTVF